MNYHYNDSICHLASHSGMATPWVVLFGLFLNSPKCAYYYVFLYHGFGKQNFCNHCVVSLPLCPQAVVILEYLTNFNFVWVEMPKTINLLLFCRNRFPGSKIDALFERFDKEKKKF